MRSSAKTGILQTTLATELECRPNVDAWAEKAERICTGVLRENVAVPVLHFERQPADKVAIAE